MPIEPIEGDPRAEYNRNQFRLLRDARIRSGWEDRAREDIDFYLGNPYTSQESSQKRSWGQDDPQINRVYSGIEKFKSLLTSRNPRYRIVGREHSDYRMAFIRSAVIDYCWDVSEAGMHLRRTLHDYSTTGLGYMYVFFKADEDYGLGDVRITHVDPFRVYVPLTARDRFHDDADEQLLSTVLSAQQLTWMFPELGGVSSTGDLDGPIAHIESFDERSDYPFSLKMNTTGSVTPDMIKDLEIDKRHFRMLERFYRVRVPFVRVFHKETGETWVFPEDEYETFEAIARTKGLSGQFEEVSVSQTRIAHVASVGQYFLYEEILNTDIYPLIPFPNVDTGTILPDSDIGRVKDPQMLLNRIFSLILLHAQNAAGLKLLYPTGSLGELEDQIQTLWSIPNVAIPYNPAAGGKPEAFQPVPLAGEFFQLVNQLSFQIDSLLGIPDILQGTPQRLPDSASATAILSESAQGRPKSKLQDIEFSLARVGRVAHSYSMKHYSAQKLLNIAQANNDREGIMEGFYDDRSGAIAAVDQDRLIHQYDVRFKGGSTLPNDPLEELRMWRELKQEGLALPKHVWRAHPDIFNAREMEKEFGMLTQLSQENEGLKQQLKQAGGQMQSMQRELLHKQIEQLARKYESAFAKILAEAEAGRKIEVSGLRAMQKELRKTVELAIREIDLEAKEAKQEQGND